MKKVYKVIVTKTVFVEAEDEDEAKDLALYDDYIMCDECIDSVRLFRYMWNGMMQGKSIEEYTAQMRLRV
jgi:hypothetical protein